VLVWSGQLLPAAHVQSHDVIQGRMRLT
jgi:hypothetical protein